MNTDYSSGSATFDPDGPGPAPVMSMPGPYGAGAAGGDLAQLFADISYSHQSGDLAWGIALVVSAQAFAGNGFASFMPYTETFANSGGTAMPSSLSAIMAMTSPTGQESNWAPSGICRKQFTWD